jgi:ferredoxin
LQQLLDALKQRSYEVVGPTVRENTVVYDELDSIDDLPIGYKDEQGGGTYRLTPHDDGAFFNYVVGPHSWKKYLFPPSVRLWQAQRNGEGFSIDETEAVAIPKLALFGARPCELHAIAIQDKVFMHGQYADPIYSRRRADLFVVAVNCAQPGGTCFCASMETGPKATKGFDVALTEIMDAKHPYFVAEVGTRAGAEVIDAIDHQKATEADLKNAERVTAQAAESMGRTLDTTKLKDLLYLNAEHPHWEEVASRCMTCGNCTMVCPTCFCVNIEDTTDLSGEQAERWRKWDSCFTMEFSYIFGGSVRASAKARYRQWMTHKLASWIDQFGTMGCVGCGRCITWCPVGIDITEEAATIRKSGTTATASRRRKNANNA